VLHGPETLYLVREQPERSPAAPNVTVTDVGVRLPAQLPASGRAMLGLLPAAQVRALFPTAASFVNRTGRGPADLPALRASSAPSAAGAGRWRTGTSRSASASVAAAVRTTATAPVAAISVTFRHECPGQRDCGATGPRWPPRCARPPPTSPRGSAAARPS